MVTWPVICEEWSVRRSVEIRNHSGGQLGKLCLKMVDNYEFLQIILVVLLRVIYLSDDLHTLVNNILTRSLGTGVINKKFSMKR